MRLHELEFQLGFDSKESGRVKPGWIMNFPQDKAPLTMRGTGGIISEDADAIWVRWTNGSKELARMRRAAAEQSVQFRGFDAPSSTY